MLKSTTDVDVSLLTKTIDSSIRNGCFPDELKAAEITPSKLLTGFTKNHSTRHYLVNMLEKWKNTLDKGVFVYAIFMDLSKAFDTMKKLFYE